MIYPWGVELRLGKKLFDIRHRALVMGILNRTPDSFYDGGKFFELDNFLAQAEKLVAQGADILDVGGVRAGPDEEVSVEQELERVARPVEVLSSRFDISLSIDTFRAAVAKEAFSSGAVLGNDISGFADPEYLRTAKAAGASVVACHMRLAPRFADPDPVYKDLFLDIKAFLNERAEWAMAAGISRNQILLDTGLDFGKTYEMSSRIFWGMDKFLDSGFPLLLAASNKEFLGYLSGQERQNRGEVSLAACALGIERGCRVIRVHDVAGAAAVAKLMEGLLSSS